MTSSTITAIATPIGTSGIGIIRISGDNSLNILSKIFKFQKKKQCLNENICNMLSHFLYLGHIVDPTTKENVDQVLVTYMKKPNSYTRQDVVEIFAHSGILVLDKILNIILRLDVRLANPGEFTQRAFENGRIDLTEAESIIELINAKNKESLQIANNIADGKLKSIIDTILKKIDKISIQINALIDFFDDVENDIDEKTIIQEIINEKKSLEKLVENFENFNYFRDNFQVVIAGKPNVGKSKLMNCLANDECSIVTDIPGTTRDIIEKHISISGLNLNILDTAGITKSNDKVEKIGIKKTLKKIESSDLVLYLIDSINLVTKEDEKILKNLKEKKIVLVINKIDLAPDKNKIKLQSNINLPTCIKISAKEKININLLKDKILNVLNLKNKTEVGNKIVPTLSQKKKIEESLNLFNKIIFGLNENSPYDIISIDIEEVKNLLEEIIGKRKNKNYIDKIFSNFCIGK